MDIKSLLYCQLLLDSSYNMKDVIVKQFKISEVNINGEVIQRSGCIKYLGANLDDRPSPKDTINRKCGIAMGNLQKLKLIKKSLTLRTAKGITMGLVILRLDYANALY